MEQIDRAQRYLERVREIYAGTCSDEHDRGRYEDDVISFFVHCHHIGDWVAHQNKVGMTQAQVNAFINRHEALRVCADLCNGSKHCRLTRTTRTGGQPHLALREYRVSTWLTGRGGGEVLRGRYTILSPVVTIDALALAERCLELWANFVAVLMEAVSSGADIKRPELLLPPTSLVSEH